jgi:UDP-N-acetyl-2-amino-2-deoxyglucuronate dehydrogenase
MRQWNVGLVGYGWVTGAHITALQLIPGVRVAAICSSRDLDPAELEQRHGRPIEVVRDLDELLARPDIDVVDICSRSNLHASQAIAAARAGKHVIVEKPIALNLAELRDLEAAVRSSGVRTCVCFEVRYSPQFTATRSLLDIGMLGDLHYAELDYYDAVGPAFRQYEWNRLKVGGGSSLLSAGCHSVDGLLLFMGTDVTEVTSYATRSSHPEFVRYEYPTTSVTIMRFANGAIGKVASVLDAHQPYYLRVHLVGSEGTVLDGKVWSRRIEGLDRDRWTSLGVKLESSADVVEHPYLAQFEAFFAALDEDREMALTSLADAVPTFEVIFAADRSAEEGRPVRLEEIREERGDA